MKLFRLTILIAATCLPGCEPDSATTTLPRSPGEAVEHLESSEQGSPTPDAVEHSPALDAFLEKFDRLAAMGWVPTLRAGSTGVGYTLETMLGIEENNSRGGDFMGMELKAYRDDDVGLNDSEKMNLFLKEPKWIDGLRHRDRVVRYGYVDDNGRNALYSTVQIHRNSHGFAFRIDRKASKVFMTFTEQDVAYWTFETLATRLREKHSEAVFVAANARGEGREEEFRYYAITWCREPSVEAFVEMIETGDVMLELRMHLKPNGSVRNHGSAFRIKQRRIADLYAATRRIRP